MKDRRETTAAEQRLSDPQIQRGATHEHSKVAFVLSGGGSLGSIQVGVVEALMEQGAYPDIIVGTSVGALNGAWLARHPDLDGVRELRAIWASLNEKTVFTGGRVRAFLRMLAGKPHLFTNEGIQNLIDKHLGDVTFDNLAVPLLVTAVDVDTGEPAVFHDGSLANAILASTAIPAVFPSVTIDGHRYIDGGLLDHFGIEVAYGQGATHVVAIDCPHLPPRGVHGILAPMARALWVSVRHLRRLGAERFELDPKMLTLEPEVDIDSYNMTDFSRTTELIQQGKSWAASYLRKNGQAFLRHMKFGITAMGVPEVDPSVDESEAAAHGPQVAVST